MLATYVEARNTPATFEEASAAMSAALATVLRATPSVEVLALALAKVTLESGRRGEELLAYSKNHCVGNIKAGPKYEGMFTTYSCNEVLQGKVVWFSPFGRLSGKNGVVVAEASQNPPGHFQTRFRAYANVFDGCYQYVDFVASGRYVDAFAELLEGDAPGYVNALHRKGYFTADPEVYGRGVLSLHKEFIARLQGRPAPALWIPTVEVIRDLVTPQKWNADEVLALEQALDIGRDATRKAARQQMRIDPNDEASTDDDEVTEPDLPGNIS